MYSSQRVDPKALFAPVRTALAEQLAPNQPVVAALDDTRIRKSGNKTHGVHYTRDPLGPPFNVNFIKAQRFLQISMACPAPNGMARMIPIDFVHAPSPKKPNRNASKHAFSEYRRTQREMSLPKVAAERVSMLRSALDNDGQPDRPLWIVVDGGYTNRSFLKGLPPKSVVVGRIRADAKLYHLPDSSFGKPGRNRVYGDRAPTPETLRQDVSVPWQTTEIFAAGKVHHVRFKTLEPLRWRPAGKEFDLRLIVIAPLAYKPTQQSRVLYRRPTYLICTDPNIPVSELIQAYVWRWDIEVNFRDEKSLLGVGQAQVRHHNSVERVPALAVAAYAMLLTASTMAFGPLGSPRSLPNPKWRPNSRARSSTQTLIQHLRHEVWANAIHFSSFDSSLPPGPNLEKSRPNLSSALFYAAA